VRHDHEAVVELLRRCPKLALELLSRAAARALPKGVRRAGTPIHIAEADVTEITPTQYRADLVIEVGKPPRLALVAEVQQSPDPQKRRTWPVYVVGLRAKLGCPVALVVIALTERMARWCARPIAIGHPGFELVPIVIGPRDIPVPRTAAEARTHPELLVLAALAHGDGPRQMAIAKAAARTVPSLAKDRGKLYADLILSHLGKAARSWLEKTMYEDYQLQSPFLRKFETRGLRRGLQKGRQEGRQEGLQQGLQKGLAKGHALAIIEVLRARGLRVPREIERRVRGIDENRRLRTLLRRARTVASARELLGSAPAARTRVR
jgi:hypothetical protein